MTEPIISLDRVEKHFGEVTALAGVSATIRQGEFFSLLGPSGCGKTTLLRVIAGFEEPSSGTVMIDGKSMAGVAANRRPTNMVFQSYAIFPHLSVAENVAYGLKRQRLGKAEETRRVDEALAMVDLAGYGVRASHTLSGGQRQRVALARALVMRPKVLLLDEPLSALDKKLREQMQTELRRLQRQVGITFMLVTHDQEEALTMSDRIGVMFDGRIAQLASPEELYSRPVSRQVASFIGIMNFLPAAVTGEVGGRIALDVAGLGAIEITADQAPGGPNGKAVSAGIRPEMLTVLLDEDERAEREVTGEVVDAAYYGDMTYYVVRLPGVEAPATISMRNTAGRRILTQGDMARVAWSPDSIVLLD
ncbi:Spermidine/putrescine import ATP-binding protein PotA [Defluviimonas aquaemixtae]|uniref:Spermidine/putrescine import ATP-binding protein PotA n=1 Tax=Albidovulum aquaemixtae TaxID=1542388 RepID=A0A2R8B3S2_9RHOB|nr:ABC transporter ATP-binding protein [Defluviimonas aquaemixtae]SPH17266.1 Spermidine/putrescine import ATP-binding protein PotA [Defluviimonas aquaemixtae]